MKKLSNKELKKLSDLLALHIVPILAAKFDVDVNDLTIKIHHFEDNNYNNLIDSLRNKLDVLL